MLAFDEEIFWLELKELPSNICGLTMRCGSLVVHDKLPRYVKSRSDMWLVTFHSLFAKSMQMYGKTI